MKRSKYILKIVVALLPSLFILSFWFSGVFDGSPTNILYYLDKISPIYFLTYFLVIGGSLSLSYFLFFESKSRLPSEKIRLSYVFAFGFLTIFPLLLFANPMANETHWYAKIFHVLDEATIQGIPPHSESVGMAIFWSTFVNVTSVGRFAVIKWIAPVSTSLLTIFMMYFAGRVASSKKLAFFVSLFGWSGIYLSFTASRYNFTMPLFAMFMGTLLLRIRGVRFKQPVSILLIILLMAQIISHPAFSLLSFLPIATVFLLQIYGWHTSDRLFFGIGSRVKTVAMIGGVSWLGWFLLKAGELPFLARVRSLWGVFVGGIKLERGLQLGWSWEPIYKTITLGRMTIGPILLLIPLFLVFLSFLLYYRGEIQGKIGKGMVAFSGIYAFLVALVPLGFLITGTTALRLEQIAFLASPIPLSLALKYLYKRKRIFIPISILLGIGMASIVPLAWIPNLTYLGQSSRSRAMASSFSSFSPRKSHLYGLGPSEIYFKGGVASRSDLTFHRGKGDYYNPFASLSQLVDKQSLPHNSYIFVTKDPIELELKYEISPPLIHRMRVLQTKLAKNYQKIYADSHTNAVYSQ